MSRRVVRIGPDERAALRTPEAGPHATGFAYAVVAQLLAYFVAVEKSTDVDRSRNLAKSVTVEGVMVAMKLNFAWLKFPLITCVIGLLENFPEKYREFQVEFN